MDQLLERGNLWHVRARPALMERRKGSLFCTVAKLFTFDHINPVIRLFGTRGRTPKYRFGLYGPQRRDPLEATACSDEAQAARLEKERITKAELTIAEVK